MRIDSAINKAKKELTIYTMPKTEKTAKRTVQAKLLRQPVVRFGVELLQSRLERVLPMMARGGIRTKREFFDYAFLMLAWGLSEAAQGNTVGSQTPAGVFRSLEMPPLKNALETYEQTNHAQTTDGPAGAKKGQMGTVADTEGTPATEGKR